MFDAASLLLITATFLLAGLVKGVVGMGLPTVAVGLLGLVVAPAQAAALLVVPSLVTNIWQLAAGRHFLALLRRLWSMMAGIAVGTMAGAGMLTTQSGGATMALGFALVLYATVSLVTVRIRVARHLEPFLSPIIGIATGFVTAATGVLVIPAVPYLQALALDKDELVQALGLSFAVSTVALGASLMQLGLFHGSLAGISLLALAPALLGMWLGQVIRARVSAASFRFWFLLCLLALGGHLFLRPLI